MHKFTGFVLLLLFSLSGFIMAQPSPSVVAEPVVYGQAVYYNHTSHITRTSDDKLIAVWTSSGTDGQIVYSIYDPVFQFWSPAAPVSAPPAGGEVHKAGIASDDNGNAYAVWQQRATSSDNWAIYFAKFDGTNWSTPVDVSGVAAENEEASVEVDDQGHIFVAWNTDSEADGAEFVYCIISTDGGATWSDPAILSSTDGLVGGTSVESGRPSLARGQNGKMVCTWFEQPDDGTNQEIFVNQFDGAQWGGEQLVSDLDGNNNRYPTVAVDASENIIVIYRPFSPRQSLVMKKKAWADATWPAAVDTVVGQGYEGYKPFLGIDDNDNFYVVFRRDNAADTTFSIDEVAYVTSTDGGASWSEQVRLSRENHDAGYITLAPRIRESGVDILWREGYAINANDPDSLSIMYGHIDVLTGISGPQQTVPRTFSLEQNYPNPFNPSTVIKYSTAGSGYYELTVYNLLGEKVRTLAAGHLTAGQYTANWNGTNDSGHLVGSGIYFYKLSGNGVSLVRKMMLIQ